MAKRNGNMGRPSVFRNKAGGRRLQALVTRQALQFFERHRKTLAQLTDRDPRSLTDADVVEYALRGEANTRDYIAGVAK
jgi:hypothetical protein